jgi:hypothetical protein
VQKPEVKKEGFLPPSCLFFIRKDQVKEKRGLPEFYIPRLKDEVDA